MQKKIHSPLCASGGTLTAYLHEPDSACLRRGVRPGVLVIPGGGYQQVVKREADPVAFEFFAAGFNVFLLDYTVFKPDSGAKPLWLVPLMQASHAIMHIRSMARVWNTAPDKIAVLGFSAGGHLAGCCATLWNAPELLAVMDTRGGMNRPDAAVLCYPVTLTGENGHRDCIARLCGDEPSALFNLPSHITPSTPPMFLWATAEDELVPCENTLAMACELQKHRVAFELHIYTHGRHGLTLAKAETGEEHPHLASWVTLCKQWLGDLFAFAVSV